MTTLVDGAAHKLFGGHDGPMSEHLGVVLHVNESNGSLDNWVQNQGNDMSCHVEFYKDGTYTQYVDLELASWCQMDGNGSWISFETEGYATEALTDEQCASIAKVYAQCHQLYGIPFVVSDSTGAGGFGWHGMGGDAWGGHYDCPGDIRKGQRTHILQLAQHPGTNPGKDGLPVDQNDFNKLMTAWANSKDGQAAISSAVEMPIGKAFNDGPNGQSRTMQYFVDEIVTKVKAELAKEKH